LWEGPSGDTIEGKGAVYSPSGPGKGDEASIRQGLNTCGGNDRALEKKDFPVSIWWKCIRKEKGGKDTRNGS